MGLARSLAVYALFLYSQADFSTWVVLAVVGGLAYAGLCARLPLPIYQGDSSAAPDPPKRPIYKPRSGLTEEQLAVWKAANQREYRGVEPKIPPPRPPKSPEFFESIKLRYIFAGYAVLIALGAMGVFRNRRQTSIPPRPPRDPGSQGCRFRPDLAQCPYRTGLNEELQAASVIQCDQMLLLGNVVHLRASAGAASEHETRSAPLAQHGARKERHGSRHHVFRSAPDGRVRKGSCGLSAELAPKPRLGVCDVLQHRLCWMSSWEVGQIVERLVADFPAFCLAAIDCEILVDLVIERIAAYLFRRQVARNSVGSRLRRQWDCSASVPAA